MNIVRTELDALLERVCEVQKSSTALGRSLRFDEVARDCLRMFEDLATCYKEESAMRDSYKQRANSWRDKAFELADEQKIAKLKIEAACPCCRGASILQPCQECHGSKLASVAYDTLRVHYKSLQEYLENVKDALRDALDVVEVSGNWLRTGGGNEDAIKVTEEVVAYARGLGVRRNCPGKDKSCP